ncbi:outer dense fiber protein 3-B-like isoform X1 [Sinocyclocheilus rhinocerous]|uniref:outer dense fiber protein 3-B-like isoform X1 n=1 Tax=Sinocyclocheilus rhinocerous TaxID=307959 RepID=UPI0007B9B56F|nr:PREDICTED: outer dense fiber protein 3-B-like isoform X1 [Sinocyclocheilus rhinocerous]
MNNHDPRMQKGPAFSFGTRHHGLQANSSPGPGYLVPSNITRVGRDGTPAYSVYGRPKDIQPFQTPGPGSYSPENAAKTTYYLAPAFSLSARTKLFRNDQTPGPAAYMLPPVLGPRVVNKASAPNVSFGGRSAIGSFHEDLRKMFVFSDSRPRDLPSGGFMRVQTQGPSVQHHRTQLHAWRHYKETRTWIPPSRKGYFHRNQSSQLFLWNSSLGVHRSHNCGWG